MKPLICVLLLAFPLTRTHAAVIGAWNLEETSGPINDSTGGHPVGNHIGTGGAPAYAQPGVPNGTYGSLTVSSASGVSMGFGPSIEDDYFVIGADTNNPTMNLDRTGSFTAMGWVRPAAPDLTGRTYRFLSTGSAAGADRGWGLGLRLNTLDGSNSSVRFTTYGVADNDSVPFTVAFDQWTHLAVTYNNGAINYFLNGNALDADTSLFGNELAAARLTIGGRLGGNDVDQMNGLVDGIRVYDSVLSLAEIQSAAIGSVSIPEPSALAGLALAAAGWCFRRRH